MFSGEMFACYFYSWDYFNPSDENRQDYAQNRDEHGKIYVRRL